MEQDDKGQFVQPYRGGRIDGWGRGMDNRRNNFDLPADVLRNVVNGDMLTSGRIRRRRGISQVIADASAHSVFGTATRMYWGTASALKSCDINYAVTTLASSPSFASPLSFVEHHGVVYVSNEQINGKIVNGVYQPWGIVPPSAAPNVLCLDDTSEIRVLREYMVTCTYVIKVGGVEIEESGAPLGVKVYGSDEGVLSISNIPQSVDSRVTHTRLYVTDVDGIVFFAQTDIPTGIVSTMVSRPFATGKQLTTQFLANMPAGQLIAFYNGRAYVAVGNILYFSEPLRYGSYHKGHGFYMFPERITLLAAVDDGLYLSADATYFLKGTPKKEELQPLLPYKAIEGAASDAPGSRDVMWLSERGIVVGAPGGKVQNVTESRIAMDTAQRACLGVIEYDGAKHAVAIMRDSTPNAAVSRDYTAAESDRLRDVQ